MQAKLQLACNLIPAKHKKMQYCFPKHFSYIKTHNIKTKLQLKAFLKLSKKIFEKLFYICKILAVILRSQHFT